ncbi:unnamed protein product [Cochlearia groenlandica]
MRTKSFPVRSSRKSLEPSPSSSSSPDEANAGGSDDKLIAQCNPQCDSDDADVEIVANTFDESDVKRKKRHCPEISETGSEGSEPLNLDACIVCGISDKRVLRCFGVNCLILFHKKCLNAEFAGGSKDPSNSYCPYCWFNLLAVKSKSLREKAVEAEKAVFKYLDKEMKSSDHEVNENVLKGQEDTSLYNDENGNQDRSADSTDSLSDQELQEDKDACSSKEEHMQAEKNCDKSRGENMPLEEETDQPEEDNGKLEVVIDKSGDMDEDEVLDNIEAQATEVEERVNSENFQDVVDKEDEISEDQTKVKTRSGKKRDASPFLSMQESYSGNGQGQVQQKQKRRARRLILNDVDSDISSNESTNERNEEDATEQIISSTQIVTSTSVKRNNQQRKHSSTTKVAKSMTKRDISVFKNDKRKKLFWTSKEEEMLKLGVEKLAEEANKNMPWRKILEMGNEVFHETRTPTDLKDKWRNMIKLGNKTKL